MSYQEKWDFYFCRVDNKKASIYLDLGYEEIAPVENMHNIAWLTLHMNNPRTDGLSSSEESGILFVIEDELIKMLNNKYKIIYVGRLTNDSKRFIYFYIGDELLVDKSISDFMLQYPNYTYDYDIKEDADWNDYLDFLYPGPKEFQSMMNRRLIDQLREAGDELIEEREVNHWIYFKTEQDRDSFLQNLNLTDLLLLIKLIIKSTRKLHMVCKLCE